MRGLLLQAALFFNAFIHAKKMRFYGNRQAADNRLAFALHLPNVIKAFKEGFCPFLFWIVDNVAW